MEFSFERGWSVSCLVSAVVWYVRRARQQRERTQKPQAKVKDGAKIRKIQAHATTLKLVVMTVHVLVQEAIQKAQDDCSVSVNLEWSRMGDEGIEKLSKELSNDSKTLVVAGLDLQWCAITDTGIGHISGVSDPYSSVCHRLNIFCPGDS